MTGNTFPAPGHSFEARFSGMAFHLKFGADGQTMRYAAADAPDFAAVAETVRYKAAAIRPGVFMATWKEANGTTVTHIENFDGGVVQTNITMPDLTFLNLSGTWTRLA